MTQEELAKKLNRHQSYIAKVEGFDRKLDVLEFITIAETLGYKPADLL